MEEKWHWIDHLQFTDGLLVLVVTSLHEGNLRTDHDLPIIGTLTSRPLTTTPDSRTYLATFREVGHFRVLTEPFNQLREPFERVTAFVYRQLESAYLTEWIDSARLFAPGVPRKAEITHYAVYAENYVVDILGGQPPILQLLSPHAYDLPPRGA